MTQKLATPSSQDVLTACQELGLACDLDLARPLCAYLATLQKWNARMNLVGPAHWREMLAELAADSWPLARFLETLPLPEAPVCMDLGAGAGLPGIPLRMLWQQGGYIMVEVRQKRALFLRQVLALAPLPGVTIHEGRAEQALAGHAPLDMVLSRAFMPWEKLLKLVAPHLGAGGLVVILANEAPSQALPSGWSLQAHTAYGDKKRHFWALRHAPV